MKKLFNSGWKFYFFVLATIVIGLGFYWLQIRPAQIKHDCSWTKMHSNAIPGRPAMTREELESKGIIRTCNNEFELLHKMVPTYNEDTDNPFALNTNYSFQQRQIIWNATSCREDGDKVIAEYKNEKKAVPTKDWYEKATKDEYTFCLHDKGL